MPARPYHSLNEVSNAPWSHVFFCAVLILQRTGLSTVIQDFFLELYNCDRLPDNPYLGLVRRFRLAESAKGESPCTYV